MLFGFLFVEINVFLLGKLREDGNFIMAYRNVYRT